MCLFTSRWNNDYNQLFGAAPKLKKKNKTKQNKQTNKQTKNRKKTGRKAGKSNFNFFGLEN